LGCRNPQSSKSKKLQDVGEEELAMAEEEGRRRAFLVQQIQAGLDLRARVLSVLNIEPL